MPKIDSALEKIKREAQETANREGKPMAVLNLNVFSPLYVIRAHIENMSCVVAVLQPQKGE